jgi:SAM-dependent methyltransferase
LHQRSKFEWFSDYVLDGHTIEFGASDGDMTILIRRAIPSSYWVYYSELKDMLRPEYGFRDIDKFIAPIEEAFSVPRFSGRFSNVFLIDVIEHLNDVVGALQGIWSILEEGGRLFIATNNGDSFRAPEAMFHHWEHTCVLTRVAVESFCRVGFVICRYFRDTADRLYVILEKRRLL